MVVRFLKTTTRKLLIKSNLQEKTAEKEGFEPPVPLPVHRISSAAHSTTLALLLVAKRLCLHLLFRLGLQNYN